MEHDSLDWVIIIILLLIMIAPIVGCFLFTIWLLKKVYQMMTMNNKRYCYIAYKHNQTGQIFDSGIQLETEIDKTEYLLVQNGHQILIRYNSADVMQLKSWVQKFKEQNGVIC